MYCTSVFTQCIVQVDKRLCKKKCLKSVPQNGTSDLSNPYVIAYLHCFWKRKFFKKKKKKNHWRQHLKDGCSFGFKLPLWTPVLSLYIVYNNGAIIVTRNGKIVWKCRRNWSFYALMLKTKLVSFLLCMKM